MKNKMLSMLFVTLATMTTQAAVLECGYSTPGTELEEWNSINRFVSSAELTTLDLGAVGGYQVTAAAIYNEQSGLGTVHIKAIKDDQVIATSTQGGLGANVSFSLNSMDDKTKSFLCQLK